MPEDADPADVGRGPAAPRRARLPGFDEIAARRDLWSTLAAHRRASGVSQDAMASRMGTTQSSVARLEAGGTDARLSTLQRYAAALDAGLSVGIGADGHMRVEVVAGGGPSPGSTAGNRRTPDPPRPDPDRADPNRSDDDANVKEAGHDR